MTQAIAELTGLVPSAHVLLIFLRVGAVFFFLPILGSARVPIRVRLGLALVSTAVIAPMVGVAQAETAARSVFFAACAGETFAGLLIGFACRGIFWIVQLAGSMASQSISLSQLLGNQVEQPSPALGHILYVSALGLAAVLDFHVLVIIALAESFAILPLAAPIPDQMLTALSVDVVSRLFYLAFGLAGPFLVIAILYNLCLGVVNKAMPSLMVAFVGAPAITWLGMAVLFLAAPIMLMTWKDHLLTLSLVFGAR